MCRIWLAVLIFSATLAHSKEHDLLDTLQQKQSIISGVLNPGSVSYNGQEISNTKENFAALLINKIPVKINSVSGLQTFYVSTDETSLELEWQTKDGKHVPILKVQYPALTEFSTDGNRLHFKFNEYVNAAQLDSKEVNLQESSVKIDNFKTWLGEVHALELMSKNNVGQIYNLNFSPIKSDLLTAKSLSVSLADSVFSANVKPTAVGASLRFLNENNFSWDIGIYLARIDYEMGFTGATNSVTQSTGQLKGRYGYNPFYTNFGGFSFKRLTFGVQAEMINYNRKSEFPSNIDGYSDKDTVSLWFLQGGYFFRWEPMQYKEWGIFLNFDIRNFGAQSNISSDSDNKSLGISYYY